MEAGGRSRVGRSDPVKVAGVSLQLGALLTYGVCRFVTQNRLWWRMYVDIDPQEIALTAHERRVRQMQRLFGQVIPDAPQVPNGARMLSQLRMLFEEVLEALQAAGVAIDVWDHRNEEAVAINVRPGSFRLVAQKVPNDCLPHLVKELADVSVTLVGMFAACGIRMEPILEAVDANNIEKRASGKMNPETGKWEKSPDHKPPNIETLLLLQGYKRTSLE